MSFKPYTIKLFLPTGEPSDFKIITKMNWTGVGLEVDRASWDKHKHRAEFSQIGIYLLIGYEEESDDLPTIYIGQGDGIKNRIDSHQKNKVFWNKAFVFTSSNNGLNRAHVTWMEWALIKKAIDIGRCKVDNSVTPNEPILTESEKADIQEFLNEVLSILPLVDIKVFEKGKKIIVNQNNKNKKVLDTIVVPAQKEGFNRVFLGDNSWYAIRISGGKLNEIKYIAAYQTSPVSAITHYAEVASIEPYGDGGKYKLNFKSKAEKINNIKYGNAKSGSMQGPRYTNLSKLLKSKTITELF